LIYIYVYIYVYIIIYISPTSFKANSNTIRSSSQPWLSLKPRGFQDVADADHLHGLHRDPHYDLPRAQPLPGRPVRSSRLFGNHQLAAGKPWEKHHLGMGQNPIPLVNIKIAGKWIFIPLKMVLIGIDPYPYNLYATILSWTIFKLKPPIM
jgi:hypothetical protein